ncbi:MAG: hypothetical protein AAGA31_01105 [Bacteroidota bacterium]
MNPIDDLFRDGLGGRKPEVSPDLWAKIKANKAPLPPRGEEIDYFFKDKLADRHGQVPAGMWERITAARGRRLRPWKVAFRAAAAILLLLVGYLALTNLPQDGSTDALAESAPAAVTTEQTTNTELIPPTDSSNDFGTEAGFKPGEEATTLKATDLQGQTNPSATTAAERQDLVTKRLPAAPTTTSSPAEEESTTKDVAESAGITTTTQPLPLRAEVYLPRQVAPLALQQLPSASFFPEPKRQYRPRVRKGSGFRAAPRHRSRTELLFGVSYSRQNLQVNSPDAVALRDARSVSEFPEAGYQITLRQTHRFSKNFHFMGGLTYAEIRNQYDYPLFGTGRDLKINNQIRMLEVPLLFGYSLPGKRLKVSLNAGPVVNLTTATRGIFLHPDFTDPLDLAEAGNYRKNVGMGFMTSLTTTYPIGNKEPFILVVEPFFKSYFSSFTQAGAPLREKYWVAGLQLGVRKGF